jgi:hypothetical protein
LCVGSIRFIDMRCACAIAGPAGGLIAQPQRCR